MSGVELACHPKDSPTDPLESRSYIMYILCDIPAVLFIRKFGFKWVPRTIILFGLVTIGNAFINTRAQFIVVRGILGGTESAVLPGNAYILARYYRRGELTVRISFFMFSAAYLASAVGGLLASAFISAKPIGVIHTWVSHGRSQRIHHY